MYNLHKHIKLGIDIGTEYTKYIAVEVQGEKELIIDSGMLNTPEGIYDADNVIFQSSKYEKFLEAIINKVKSKTKLKKSDIVVTIGLTYLELTAAHFINPYSENKDFDAELDKVINLSGQFDNSKFSFGYAYKNLISTPLAVCDTLIIGYNKDIVNFLLKFFDKRNIYINNISLSNLNVIKNLPKKSFEQDYELEYSLLIDLGAKTTEVVLLKNDFPLNYFLVNKGGNDITKALQEQFKMTFEEAEKLKISTNESESIFGQNISSLPVSSTARDIIEILRPIFGQWISQISLDVNAELRLQRIPRINKVYFTGGSSSIKNLPESIASIFNAELCEVPLINFYNTDQLQREAEIVYYNKEIFFPALSLLNPFDVNFRTPEYTQSKVSKLPKMKGANLLLVGSIAVFIGANAFGMLQSANNNSKISDINNAMGVLVSQYNSQQQKISDYKEMEYRVSAFESEVIDKVKWSSLMSKIYDASLDGIQVTSIKEIGEGEFEIVGNSTNYQLVGLFGKLLQKDENSAFETAEPVSIISGGFVELENGSTYEIKEFVIRGTIHPNNLVTAPDVIVGEGNDVKEEVQEPVEQTPTEEVETNTTEGNSNE